MIQTLSHQHGAGRILYLRPNRALSREQWLRWFLAIVLTCLLVASWSARFGNLFAPLFALLDVGVLALAFVAVWRAGERSEWIELAPDCITVRRESRGISSETGRFHPAWVRLIQARHSGGDGAQLLLRSHGRAVEIGAFLADEERNELAAALRQALEELKVGEGLHGSAQDLSSV
jgi:uncharacterized membrane protein